MKYPVTASRLREALNDNNMKPQELSNLCGVNKASISQYVNGSHAPSNLSASKMAKCLHVSPLWLMGFDTPKEDRETIEKQIMDKQFELNQLDYNSEDKIIKTQLEISELVKKLKLIAADAPVSHTPEYEINNHIMEVNTDNNDLIPEIRIAKAVELYDKIEKAEPNIKEAILSLLKGVQ